MAGLVSEMDATLKSVGLVVPCGVSVVDGGRAHLYAEVVGDVKVGELGIDIGIHYGDKVHTDKAEDAQVALTTIVVLSIFEHSREILLVGLYIVSRR